MSFARKYKNLAASLVALSAFTSAVQAATLEDVRARDSLICGVSEGLVGFSQLNGAGEWVGFDVDFCKAVATVIFNDPDKVEYVSLDPEQRFDALASGEIDLLSRNSTWTMGRDLNLGLNFISPIYIDGQSFLVPALYGMTSVQQMEGATICVVAGTTSEVNGPKFFTAADMPITFLPFDDRAAARNAYEAGQCDALTGDRSALAGERSLTADPNAHILLRDFISKEPLAPVVREGDDEWGDLIRWTLFAMINAEELELTGQDRARFIELGAPATQAFGLQEDWFQKLVLEVGTYETIFEHHLGVDSALELRRGLNALWTEGGLLYAPPMQ